MRREALTRISALAVPVVVALGGCTAISAPAIVATPPQGLAASGPAAPSAGGSSAAPKQAARVPADRRWRPGGMQEGFQIYAHNAKGTPADANIEPILDYVVARGANSVAFSFPIYTDGQRPRSVRRGPETPTPAVLARLVAAAHGRGLRVTVRPLIDEATVRTSSGGWRGTIQPPRLAAWFRSYERALAPYLAASHRARADEFVLATELTSLQPHHERWRALARSASRIFPGTLSYTFNWDAPDTVMLPTKGAAGLDLYFDVDLGPDATVEQLAAALTKRIMAKPKKLRSAMVAQEVGIAAENGAYRHPWNWGSAKSSAVNPAIQVNWFTAACAAVRRSGLDGIYFWMLDSSVDPSQVNPDTESAAGFIGRPGEGAIERCFAGMP